MKVTGTAKSSASPAGIADPDAAIATAHHPEQIQTIEAVHAAFEKEMLAAGCDDNGEMLPGVDLVQGSPTITVRTEAHAEEAIAAHLADSGLSWGLALDQIKGIGQ